MASAWAAVDPVGALVAVIDWESYADLKGSMLSVIMSKWSGTDPRAAMDWLLAAGSNQVRDLVSPAFYNLAKSDLAGAEALVATLPSESARRSARRAVFGAILDQQDLDRTMAAFADLDVRDQSTVAHRLAERLARESPQQAFEWFIGLDEQVRKDSFNWTLNSLHRRDAALVKELIQGIADPGLRIQAARTVARQNVTAQDLDWAESLGTERDYAPVVGDVFHAWFGQDAQSASAALGRYPRGPARDDALDRLVGANLSAFDPLSAERLFDAIESPAKRRTAARRLHRYYTEVDPNERKAAAFQDLASDEDS